MAVGKEIGQFELKSTSVKLEPGKSGAVILDVNFEGASHGDLEGAVLATMRVDSDDGKDGNYKVSARCFLDNGDIVDANGQGKTSYNKNHTWSVAGVTEGQNGKSWAIRGDIDLADRSFVGKLFERN